MTRQETQMLIAAIASVFPNFQPDKNIKMSFVIDTWQMVLADVDYQQMQKAFKAYCVSDNKGFAPSPGQLVTLIREIESPVSSTATEAWSKVARALRDSLYHAEERFEGLPELAKMVIGSPQDLQAMASIAEDSVNTVIQSQFLREYRRMEDVYRKEQTYPEEIRKEIEARRRSMRTALETAKENQRMLEDREGE